MVLTRDRHTVDRGKKSRSITTYRVESLSEGFWWWNGKEFETLKDAKIFYRKLVAKSETLGATRICSVTVVTAVIIEHSQK